MINNLTDNKTLNNNTSIPPLGLGVFQIPNEETATVVENAIKNGYRLIDTAQIYGNEEGTGLGIKRALENSDLKREDLFVTSKVWNKGLSYDETIKAYESSLEKLGLDYLDLYLIHWPGLDSFKDAWMALETLYKTGRVKAIGVSNFEIHHLEELKSFATVTPVINQIELHPKLSQATLREYATEHKIQIQAWSPLMQGQILTNEVISAIAAAHQKTTAQIVLRWALQQDIILNVKSVHEDRMKSNRDVFDFELTEAEMKQINDLNEDLRVGPNPDEFNF